MINKKYFTRCVRVSQRMLRGIQQIAAAEIRNIANYNYRKSTPYRMRHDDVYLVSFPRSGNTWLSFLVANVIVETIPEYKDREVNYFNLHQIIPAIHATREIQGNFMPSPYSRIIKSHSEYNPYYKQIILLIRDPRDVLVSYYKFMRDLLGYRKDLPAFIRDKKYGIDSWANHTRTWLENMPATARFKVVRFENLKMNTASVISELFLHMGIRVNETVINRAVEKSSFEKMQKLEMDSVTDLLGKRQNYRFLRRGKTAGYRDELDENDRRYIEKRVSQYMKYFDYTI